MELLYYPSPILKTVCTPVKEPIPESITQEMITIMKKHNGIGLSAIQVGITQTFFVMFDGTVVVNPYYTVFHKPKKLMKEGCLSVPGFFDKVLRYEKIETCYYDAQLKEHTEEMEGLRAHVFQHEFDHGLGKMFTDHLTSANRSLIRGNMQKLKRQGKL